MAGKRIDTIDMLKGILIIYVVMYHLFAWEVIAYLVFIPLFGACMLMFFAMSGYTYSVGKRSYGQSVLARLKRVVLPLALYEIAIYIINSVILVLLGNCTVSDCLSGVVEGLSAQVWREDITSLTTQDLSITFSSPGSVFQLTIAPFWFLVTMFLGEVIFFAVAGVVKKGKLKPLLTIAGLALITVALKLLVTIDLPFNLQDIPAIAGVMLLGLYFKENGIFAERKLKGIKYALTIIGGFILCLVLYGLCGVPLSVGAGVWGTRGALSVVSAFLMTVIQLYMQLSLCDVMSKAQWLKKGLSYLGRTTMPILLLHCFFGVWIKYMLGLQTDADFDYTLAETLLSLLVVVVSIGLSCLWQKLMDTVKSKSKRG